jgi:hypothetical protein
MPLISTFSLDDHTKLCVWKIEENIDFFLQDLDFTSFDNNEFNIIKNVKKRLLIYCLGAIQIIRDTFLHFF